MNRFKEVTTAKAPKIPNLPQALIVPATACPMFLTGQIGTRPDGTLVLSSFADEVRQALNNVQAIIEEAGGKLEDVVNVTIALISQNDWETCKAVYAEVFGDHHPTRTVYWVSGLPLAARVEISVIAAL